MITYKAIIVQGGRRKDGTWPVKIRVTFKGTVRRLPTTLVCTDSDLTRSGRIKNATILERAGELIARMREATADLSPFTLDSWTVDDVVAHIRDKLSAQHFRLDFFTFADDFLQSKTPQTRRNYETALHTFERFLGSRELDVNAITRALLLDFRDFADAENWMHWTAGILVESSVPKKVKGGAGARHLGKLAHIFQAAKYKYNDEDSGHILIPRSPFDGLPKASPPGGLGQKPQDVATIQAVIDWVPEDDLDRITRAAFLLSFCTMGANMADLYEAKDPGREVWKYNRKKTRERRADKAEARVFLSETFTPLLRSLGGQSGDVWLCPDLHRWRNANIATAAANRRLRRWCTAQGLPPFAFGAARKSWGTIARAIGVEKATVDEGLVHVGDFRIADIYAQRNWSLAWAANEKVLSLFDWASLQNTPD